MPHEAILDWLARIPVALADLFRLLAAGFDLSAPRQLLGTLLVPPGLPMLLLALGLLLGFRWLPRAGRAITWIALAGLWFTSSGLGAGWLASLAEADHDKGLTVEALDAALRSTARPQAIVILGGGSRQHPGESPDPQTVRPLTLERLVHGAWLARNTRLPVLVSGGPPRPGRASEASLMKRTLEQALATPVRWTEETSRDTGENARFSAQLLRDAGVERIILVTQAYHMPRAEASFRRAGLSVLPAPHGFAAGQPGWQLTDLIPNGSAAELSYRASHELLGRVWYRIRGR